MDAVRQLYEQLPYPPPLPDVDAFRDHRSTFDGSPRYYANMYWPRQVRGDDLDILVAGCGSSQAVKVAVQQPAARVTAIDISDASLDCTRTLAAQYELQNLTIRSLPIERVDELGQAFDFVLSTGVLHHLVDPDVGLRALRNVLRPDGAMHLMVYATYGRTGVAMVQDYCTRLGITTSSQELRDLVEVTRAFPDDHPLRMFTRVAPDLTTAAGAADALLHPQEVTYTVPEVFTWLDRCGMTHMRWFLQAPYHASCGRPSTSPHGARLAALPACRQHAAIELLRGTMITHTFAACRDDRSEREWCVGWEGDAWRGFVPSPFPGARAEADGRGGGTLRHPGHRFEDLALSVTAEEALLCAEIDGTRSIEEIARRVGRGLDEGVRGLFVRLWEYDQVLVRGVAPAKDQ